MLFPRYCPRLFPDFSNEPLLGRFATAPSLFHLEIMPLTYSFSTGAGAGAGAGARSSVALIQNWLAFPLSRRSTLYVTIIGPESLVISESE